MPAKAAACQASGKNNLMFRISLKFQLTGALSLLCFAAAITCAQTDLAKKQEAYQNQQRAANLSALRANIKLLDDAPQRCSLKFQIAKFVYEQNVTNYFETANSLVLECLDEMADNSDQFTYANSRFWKGWALSLLKKYAPEAGRKAEKKYFAGSDDNDLADRLDAHSGNPADLANRMTAKIANGEMPNQLDFAIGELRETNNPAALRLLSVTLDYYQAHIERTYADSNLNFLGSDYLDARTPAVLRQRYHSLLVRMGEESLAQPQNSQLLWLSTELLKNALPDIKLINAELYPRAFSIYNALKSRKSSAEKEKEEVMERINASKDKLAQTISEAESAENKNLKNELWLYASGYAQDAKKFRLAAELRLKMETHGDWEKFAHYFFITEQLLDPCLTENDIESAQYIVGLVENPQMKSQGLFKIAARLIELKKRDAAYDVLSEGWKVLEKIETGAPKTWAMRQAIPIALKIDKNRAFDMAGDLVAVVNRFPTPGADDKPGTEARQKYAATLSGVSSNLDSIFRQLGKENLPMADAISQGIQLKEWRLAVQIALETERPYPLPPEPAANDPAKP
jgi:hypothetical protein